MRQGINKKLHSSENKQDDDPIVNPKNKVKPKLIADDSSDSRNISFIMSEQKETNSFTNKALEGNHESDILIASNRDNLLKKGLYVFDSVIKTLFSNKEELNATIHKLPQHGASKLSLQANNFFGTTSGMHKSAAKEEELILHEIIIESPNLFEKNKKFNSKNNIPPNSNLSGDNHFEDIELNDDL